MTRARLGALAVLATTSLASWAPAATAQTDDAEVFVFLVPGVSFEELMGPPEISSLASHGGAALMSLAGGLPTRSGSGVVAGEERVRTRWLDPEVEGGLDGVVAAIEDHLEAAEAEGVLVIVASTTPSAEMLAAGDELHPIVMARGAVVGSAAERAEAGTLTSDSTRRTGVVSDLDVVPTIAAFLGTEPPADAAGSPIRIVDGPPPFELHQRYLAQRRMYVPIGTAAAVYVALVGIAGVVALALGRRFPRSLRRIIGWGALSVAALTTALLAAGHLPELTYASVVPFVALVTVFGTLAFAPLEHRDVLLVPAGIGIGVLAFFALEAIVEWTAALTPFVGGSELDGGRFYGLPNVFIGLLIGACLWVAQRLRTSAGFALLVIVALFGGLPYLGSNLGGAVSLFAAAGLWLALRERQRLGLWKGLAVLAGVTIVGTALIMLAHAVSPLETHVTRFEEEADGLAGSLERFWDRLRVGFDLIERNPFALIPVIGLPVAIAVVLRPPAALRPSLARSPAWRDAILVTLLAGVVAYLVNDSGPAAAGLAFGLGLGGLMGVSLLSEVEKMGGP